MRRLLVFGDGLGGHGRIASTQRLHPRPMYVPAAPKTPLCAPACLPVWGQEGGAQDTMAHVGQSPSRGAQASLKRKGCTGQVNDLREVPGRPLAVAQGRGACRLCLRAWRDQYIPQALSAMTQRVWAREHLWYRQAPGTEQVLTERERRRCSQSSAGTGT